MASEAEVERLVVRLVGDGSSYQKMMAEAIAAAKQVEHAEATMSAARKRGEAVTRSVLTAEELYQDELRQLQQLLDAGVISQETHSRAMQKAETQFVAVSAASQTTAQSIQTTASNSQQLGQKFEKLASQAMGAGTVITGLGVAVSGLFGGLAYDAVDRASDFQTTMISYKAMLGSEAQSLRMLKNLRDFSAKTPFEMPTLLNATQMLLQFQVPANEILDTLKNIGDVTGGSDPGKVMAMSYAFAQMSSTGRLMGQDLIQMVNAGFNPLTEIAKTSGKSLQELRKEMEQGRITADMVKEAFASASTRLNLMEEQSQSLTGRLSTLKDNFGLLLLEVGARLTPVLSFAVDKVAMLVGWLQDTSPAVKTVLAGVVGLGTGIGILVTTVGGVLLTVGALSGALSAVISLWGAYTTAQAAAATATTVTTAAQGANVVATNLTAVASIKATAATVALKTATLALQGALAVVVAVGFFKLTQSLSGATADYDQLNRAIERNKALQGKVEQNFVTNTEEVVTTVRKTENPEQRVRVAQEELDLAIKAVEGYQASLAGAKQQVKELDTTWNNFSGNKILAEAKQEAADVDAMLAAANDRVKQLEQEIQKAQDPLNRAFDTRPLDELEKSLAQQIQMFGKTGVEAEIYGMVLKGASDDQLAYVDSLQHQLNQLAAQTALKDQQDQLSESVNTLTASLQEQVQTFHMSSTEAAIYRLKTQGATDDQVKAAEAASAQLTVLQDEKRAREEANDVMEEGRKLVEQYLPAEKKLEKAQKELANLFGVGAIDQDTYRKATQDLEQQFKGLESQFNKEYKADLSVSGVDAVAADSAEAMARLEEYYSGTALRKKPTIKLPEISVPTSSTTATGLFSQFDFSQFRNFATPSFQDTPTTLYTQQAPSMVGTTVADMRPVNSQAQLQTTIDVANDGWNIVSEQLDTLIAIEEKKNPIVMSEASL